jgi:ketosteroid isomerase-like protein
MRERDAEAAAVVERYLAALGAQDWPALADCLAPDVERIGPYGDVVHGREPYASFLERTVSALSGYELSVGRLLVAADAVTVELGETVDTAAGRRRTDEAVVFDVDAAGLIRRVAVYLRSATTSSRGTTAA